MNKRPYKNEGSIIILLTLVMVILIGFTALVIDIGMVVHQRGKLQYACDASALAGAQELPKSTSNAIVAAKDYAQKNGVPESKIQISFSNNTRCVILYKQITVTATYKVNFFFARVLGINGVDVKANSTAIVGPVIKIKNRLQPFGILPSAYVLGQQVVLKQNSGDSQSGNYGALALGGKGASNYQANIVYGFNGLFSVGDYVETEPGNMAGPTEKGVQELISKCTHIPRCTPNSYVKNCPRVITVAIVDTLDVSGRKNVKILGFARFFLEYINNKAEVTGRFVEEVAAGELGQGQIDYGLRTVKLVN